MFLKKPEPTQESASDSSAPKAPSPPSEEDLVSMQQPTEQPVDSPASDREDGQKKAKKWPTVIAEGEGTEELLEPVREGDPSADVTKPIDWDKADSYRRSAEGAAGVFFVSVEGGVVVVKGSMTIVQEVFVAALAEKLHVRVPKIRVIKHHEEEMASMKRNILRLAEVIGPADVVKVERELDRPFVMLMEFTGGKDVETLSYGWCTALLSCKGENKECPRLRAMGNLAALDMLTNNWDRMPFVWDNSGNWKNMVMHRNDTEWEIVGIDQGLTAIVIAEGMEKYTERIKKYVTKLVKQPSKEASETKSVREILRGHTTYDIGVNGSLEIQRGILDVVSQAAGLSKQDMSELKDKIADIGKVDSNDVWQTGLASIDLDFLATMITVFGDCLA